MTVNAIEEMAAQRMALGQAGVVEVGGGIVNHADLLHHPARALILGNGKRDKAGEAKGLKGEVNHGARAFGGQASAPAVESETPANFNRGHEWRVVAGDVEADKADEPLLGDEFGGVDAVAVTVEVLLDAGDEVVGLLR